MLAKQKQAILRLRSVQEFLAVHPPPESPGYAAQKKALDEVVVGLRDYSHDQAAGRRLRQGEVARQRAVTESLRREHLAPITEIARINLGDAPGIDKVLKLPRFGISPVKLLGEASAMRTGAAALEPRFVEAGLPPDFLQQLDAAIETLSQSISGKARTLGQQVGGRAGLEKEIRRGRMVLTGLDAIVKRAFRGKAEVLEKWRTAKRLNGVAGGNGNGAAGEATPDISPTEPAAADVAGRVAS